MHAPTDRKKVIRLAVLALSLAGLTVAVFFFLRFVHSVAANAVEGGPALTRYAEYYKQIGAYYARGFTTGFFVCYFLMLFAMIVGSWVDEKRRGRKAARATGAAIPEANPAPVLAGEPVTPES
jgi:hypothetical protein